MMDRCHPRAFGATRVKTIKSDYFNGDTQLKAYNKRIVPQTHRCQIFLAKCQDFGTGRAGLVWKAIADL